MNAVYAKKVFGAWSLGGFQIGHALVILTLVSAGALLSWPPKPGSWAGPVCSPTWPRISWVPHRFAQLSRPARHEQRHLAHGLAAIATLLYTHGSGLEARRHVLRSTSS